MYVPTVASTMFHSPKRRVSVQVQSNTIKYNQIQLNTIKYNQAQSSTIKYNQVQSSTINYNQVQSNSCLAILQQPNSVLLPSSTVISRFPPEDLNLPGSKICVVAPRGAFGEEQGKPRMPTAMFTHHSGTPMASKMEIFAINHHKPSILG